MPTCNCCGKKAMVLKVWHQGFRPMFYPISETVCRVCQPAGNE